MGPLSVLEMRSCSQRQNKFTLVKKSFRTALNSFGVVQILFWWLPMVLVE